MTMRDLRFIIMCVVLCCFAFSVMAQEGKLARANKKFEKYAFIDARDIYLELAENGYESLDVFQKIGDSYYFNAKYENAQKWYKKLVNKYQDSITPEYYFRYAQTLRALKNYDQADAMMTIFNEINGDDSRATLFTEKPDYIKVSGYRKSRYILEDIIMVNSRYSDFGTTISEGKLIFASSRDTGIVARRTHKWNNQPFLNLYQSTIKDDGSLTRPKPFSDKLNSKFHESTSAFSKDGNTVYFTRNNFIKGNYGKSKNGTNKLKIYRATKNGQGWNDPEELPFNDDEFSTAHPVLNADNTKLYFASDREGTIGMSDIWVVTIESDGSFGEPENLGRPINTEGRETFPYLSDQGNLYFASDGHPGLGGLDVFVTHPEDEEINIVNLGEPINSSKDDFAFIVNDNTKVGYLSSNRKRGMGSDDIYRFKQEELPEPTCDVPISGVITDKDSGDLIPNATVRLLTEENEVLEETIVGEDAVYHFTLVCSERYIIRASEERYYAAEAVVTTPAAPEKMKQDLELERRLTEVKVGDDLAKLLDLKPIYFDYDRFNIRPDAAEELTKVVSAMKQIPTMVISARSHTDSRGRDGYNLSLSEKRAQATVDYIISEGIDRSRISGKGYGETELVNNCSNGVTCSEEEHQLNRRSEFIVISQ